MSDTIDDDAQLAPQAATISAGERIAPGRLGISVVIPAYNEGPSVGQTVLQVRRALESWDAPWEVIVVDDGSRDDTAAQAERAGATVFRHPVNLGYGNSLLTGIARAHQPLVAICDADGSYPVELIPELAGELQERGLDMLVGARQGQFYRGSLLKRMARFFFGVLAEFTCGRKIPDINSGLRVMRRDLLLRFQSVLCGGFSFTTTLTIISLLTYHFVAFRNIPYHARTGSSHVRYFRDTLRTLQILVSTIVIFNPIKFHLLVAMLTLGLGLLAVLACRMWPAWQGEFVLLALFGLTAEMVMAVGLLAEQRRAAPQGSVPFQRKP